METEWLEPALYVTDNGWVIDRLNDYDIEIPKLERRITKYMLAYDIELLSHEEWLANRLASVLRSNDRRIAKIGQQASPKAINYSNLTKFTVGKLAERIQDTREKGEGELYLARTDAPLENAYDATTDGLSNGTEAMVRSLRNRVLYILDNDPSMLYRKKSSADKARNMLTGYGDELTKQERYKTRTSAKKSVANMNPREYNRLMKEIDENMYDDPDKSEAELLFDEDTRR